MKILNNLYNHKIRRSLISYNFIFSLIDFFPCLFSFGENAEERTARHEQEQGQEQFETYSALLESLIPTAQANSDAANKQIESLLANSPKIDLSSFSKNLGGLTGQLSSIKSGLGRLSGELSYVRQGTESDVSKYLTKGEGYISSMLDEATQGADKYLKQYQKLANTEMPGMSVYRDQEQASLGSSLQQLKSMGGTSSGAIGALLGGSEQAKANLAIQAANYKSQSSKDLANAYLTSGNTKSGAYSTATGLTQNQAGIRQNLGSFSSGIIGQQADISGQQADIVGQQSNIIGQQASLAGTEFQINELNPYEQNLSWRQTQATMNDPLQLSANIYGSLTGMGWSQQQSGVAGQIAAGTAQQQTNAEVIAALAQLASSYNNNNNNNNNNG
jgi:hypothetical protein